MKRGSDPPPSVKKIVCSGHLAPPVPMNPSSSLLVNFVWHSQWGNIKSIFLRAFSFEHFLSSENLRTFVPLGLWFPPALHLRMLGGNQQTPSWGPPAGFLYGHGQLPAHPSPSVTHHQLGNRGVFRGTSSVSSGIVMTAVLPGNVSLSCTLT